MVGLSHHGGSPVKGSYHDDYNFFGYGFLSGRNTGTPVSRDYEPPFRFTGQIEKVTIEVKEDKK